MKILVIGATGGSGRAATAELLRRGHTVTAFSRHASSLELDGDLITVDGDATDRHALAAATAGQDAIVITLGISESAIRVRLRGPAATPSDVRSRGTAVAVDAARAAGVGRLVVQSSYGVGPTRPLLGAADRAIFALLLKPQIADTELQEQVVRDSDLEWTLVQPVHLTYGPEAEARVTTDGAIGARKISRLSVARVLADAAEGRHGTGRTLSVSG
ncbi:NAD(P)-binding oxidoreductase [Aeromicrobium sp. NPDC092404]|uniref:NAD(P)-dependent oxidoreductase n=1 Tax=Aeromicrobium sp. NPDC092404 TaxID=3154976 RepID=UPI003429A711